jgi:peptidyl-prolyl cis-trans isomerase C
MHFPRSLIFLGTATVLLGQTPPPTTQPAEPAPHVQLSVDNPTVKLPDVPPEKVVLTVGDIKITAGQFNVLIDNLQPQYRNAARGNANGRKQLADNIVKMLALAQEAQKRKLDQTPEFKAQEMFQSLNILANVLASQVTKDVLVSDADLRQYYEAHKNDFDSVHAKHILIRFQGSTVPVRPGQKDLTDAEALAKAQEIRKKIQDGADFATLAKAESDDTGSGANSGGDMPAFRHGQMVPSFEAAAFAMKAGELSEPVRSQFGYHIIFVVSHSTFEEVRPAVEARMKPEEGQKAVNKFIEELQKTTPPVLDPDYFPPSPPALTPPAAVPPPTLKPPDKK